MSDKNCAKCGAPLKTGNIKIVRKKGKRPRRECRRCPAVVTTMPAITEMPKKTAAAIVEMAELAKRQIEGTTRAGSVTVAGVFDFPEPTNYRFFMAADQADRMKKALDKPFFQGFGIGFEVIPVPDYQVEADPDAFADMVEVTVDWKAA